MILPSFITNGSFLEILRQNSWILGVFDSSYQGLLLEGPKRGWHVISFGALIQDVPSAGGADDMVILDLFVILCFIRNWSMRNAYIYLYI